MIVNGSNIIIGPLCRSFEDAISNTPHTHTHTHTHINCPNVVEVFLSSVSRMTQTSQRSGVNKKTSTTLGQLMWVWVCGCVCVSLLTLDNIAICSCKRRPIRNCFSSNHISQKSIYSPYKKTHFTCTEFFF